MKHKIYVFCNTKCEGKGDWHSILAIGDDGNVLAGHLCSHHWYISNDMGFSSNWKHEHYNKHFGEDNWELEYIKQENIESHEGLQKALKENKKIEEKKEKL